MSNKLPNKDIEFQPKTSEYSFTTRKPGEKTKSILNTFFTLVSGTFALILIFLLFLGVLNYFNVISLSTYFPSFIITKLPNEATTQSLKYSQKNNTWTLVGKLDGYDQDTIQINYKSKIISLLSDSESEYYIQGKNKIIAKTEDFKTPKNVGKDVNVIFKKDKNDNNLIKQITLFTP